MNLVCLRLLLPSFVTTFFTILRGFDRIYVTRKFKAYLVLHTNPNNIATRQDPLAICIDLFISSMYRTSGQLC